MIGSFWIITAASGLAILLLSALAVWAHHGAAEPALTESEVRAQLALEYPQDAVSPLLIDQPAKTALCRAGQNARLVMRLGDYCVVRSLPWDAVAAARPENGKVRLSLPDPAAPHIDLVLGEGAPWPPTL